MTISATEFKAKCLELLDRVNETGEPITITKRGHVVAELRAPYGEKVGPARSGFAKGLVTITGDIMAPLDVEWNALKPDFELDPNK